MGKMYEEDTVLLKQRKPTIAERKGGAEIVFVRIGVETKAKYNISACVLYESWEQWGEPVGILSDNVEDVQVWRDSIGD